MNKIYELNYLTDDFYKKYNSVDYPEIENKKTRPYMVLLIKVDDNIFAIPFRTNIRHKYCYKFKKSNRDTSSVTGLDYTKAVIVNDEKYIGNRATIDNKEYIELNSKYYFFSFKLTQTYTDLHRLTAKKFCLISLTELKSSANIWI